LWLRSLLYFVVGLMSSIIGKKQADGRDGLTSIGSKAITLFDRTATRLFLIAILGFIVYSNSFHVPFVFDDESSILDNPVIKSLGNFLSSSKGYTFNPRRFVGYLTIAMNYAVGGFDVTGYHAFNLAVHIVNAFLVYALTVLTFRTPYMRNSSLSLSSRAIAFFTAALFVVHPIETQAVTYVVQRFTSLTTMFYLMSLSLYARWRLLEESGRSPRRKAFLWYFLALVAAVLAMKTKEIAFTLPIMVVIYEFFFFRLPMRRRLPFLAPILATLFIIPLSLLNIAKPLGQALSDVSEVTRIQTDVSRWDYLFTQFRVIVTYIRLLVFPVNQNLDYDYPMYHSFSSPPVILSFLFLLALFIFGLYLFLRSRRCDSEYGPGFRLVSFGIMWFFVTLSVESSVIPIVDLMFEHRAYLPSVGFISAFVVGAMIVMSRLKRKREKFFGEAVAPVLVVMVLLFGLATYSRNMTWKDPVTLWSDVVKKSPAKARTIYDLGQAYDIRGQAERAADLYRTAIRLDPYLAHAYNNLANIYEKQGRVELAIWLYRKVIALYPEDAIARTNLGAVYAKQGRYAEATAELTTAIRIKPDYAIAHNNLGNVYYERGYLDDALREYQTAIKVKEDFSGAYNNLGLVYVKKGLLNEAAEEFRLAIRFEPGGAEPYNNLGMVYLKQGNFEGALHEFQRASALQPGNPAIHANIGRVYLSTGNLEEALRAFQTALAIAPDLSEVRNYLETTKKRLQESTHRK
jgi:tetratricopeptide (TPR) repeat protein